MNPTTTDSRPRTLQERITLATVAQILAKPLGFEWSLQGFGMLRLYLPETRYDGGQSLRLHVWDDRYATPGVSTVHTHPWDFASYVVAGRVENLRFERMDEGTITSWGAPAMEQRIRCGVGGGLDGFPQSCRLESQTPEVYRSDDYYTQLASEIHESKPENGTVTIVSRSVPDGGHPDYAYVYFRIEDGWVSAEPRPATDAEVADICSSALDRWF